MEEIQKKEYIYIKWKHCAVELKYCEQLYFNFFFFFFFRKADLLRQSTLEAQFQNVEWA